MTEAQWRPRDVDIELRTELIVFHQGSLQATVMVEPGDYPETGQVVHVGEPGSSLSLLGKIVAGRRQIPAVVGGEKRLVKYYGLADPELEDLKVLGLVVDEGDND